MSSPLNEKLRRGEVATLINADHPSSSLVASLHGLGLDAVMIDCEQGSPGLIELEDMRRAAREAGMSALVRIPASLPWVIERYMMRDIDGVVIPRLDSAAQAAKAIDDIAYCVPHDFDDKTIVVQIESVAAVDDLDALLAIDRVDSYFVGAVDLAKSMGLRGDYRNPEAQSLIISTIRRIVDAGRSAGMLVKEDDVRDWCARGVNLCYAHVNDFVRIGAREWHVTAGLSPTGDRI